MKCPECKEKLNVVMVESNLYQDVVLKNCKLTEEVTNETKKTKFIYCPECSADLTKYFEED
jgi:hypothetical protein